MVTTATLPGSCGQPSIGSRLMIATCGPISFRRIRFFGLEIWGALLYGGRLVVVPFLVSRSPEAFYDLLVKEKVTV
jgi:non-ribosomal peptide synthetase component F